MNRAANGRLAEAISLGDVNISAILAPVHQRQQQTVFQRVLGLAPAPRKMRTERLAHLVESRGPHTRQALEDTLGLSFQVGVEHANSILELRKRSTVYLVRRFLLINFRFQNSVGAISLQRLISSSQVR